MSNSELNTQNSILFIVGPTACGKSGLAMKLAKELDGEIIAADSQTVRKELTIGTAKPTEQDRADVPHHLIDIIDPYDDSFNVAQFKELALAAVADIRGRGKLPIVVGGTGLYVDALFYNYDLSKQDMKLREELTNKTVDELKEMIRQKGYELPENDMNPRHLIGVISRKGKSPKNLKPVDGALIYGITREDDELKQRISDRIDNMFAEGFMDEVSSIRAKYGPLPKNIDAIGYPIAEKVLAGDLSVEQAKDVFKRADWQYARRQKSWLRRNPYIKWLSGSVEASVEAIKTDLATD